ncbi:amino acid adenylation domain-containing protein [Pedobacter sp.]|uniref:amino acid adenylation domain-containing protein n=1 Tax=Pedobacter sp. TaxID=1411316 RepID=UPI003BA89F4A
MINTLELDKNFTEVNYNPFEKDKDIEKIIVLNESQKELWLSCVIGGDSANLAYNESVSLKLSGKFDLSIFKKAIIHLTETHEALRSNVSKNGERLIVYKNVNANIFYHDFSIFKPEEVEEKLKSFIHHEISIPFDLYNDNLFKIYVHKIDEHTTYITLIIHHIIGDGWSIGIFLEDLSSLYNNLILGNAAKIDATEQISTYATELVSFEKTEEYKKTQEFWLNQYKNDVPVLNLPIDFSRPSIRTYEGKRNDYLLNESLYNSIKGLAAKANCSVVSTLIAAFEVFLYHQTGQEDIVLGLPAAGQLASEQFRVVGHCVNLLPLRSKIIPEQAFIEYLKVRRNEIYEVYDNQRLTFSELLKKINVKRNQSTIPLVPVVFNVDKGMDDNVKFEGLTHKITSNPRVCQTFEISLNVNGSKDAVILEWAYNTQLFKTETIDRMMEDFEALLINITSNPELLISNSFPEKNAFPKITPNYSEYPKDKTIIDLFAEQVVTNGSKRAIIFEGKHLTYKQLDEKSNQIANYLGSRNVKNNNLVPICINPSLEMIVAILGVLKAGAAYVPIDPDAPSFRIKQLTDSSESNLILTDLVTSKKLNDGFSVDVLAIDESSNAIWNSSKTNPNVKVNQNDLIYIIYTSGSTGTPKGVMIPHGNIVDYLYGLIDKLPTINECRSFALGSSISTDLGNTTLFSSLINGAELHLFSKDRFNSVSYIHDYFKTEQIDFLKIVPSHWKHLTYNLAELYPKKLLMFGGESLPGTYIKKINDSGTSCVVVNHYGPTETTIGKLLHIVDKNHDYSTTIPIGKPFSNTSVYVLNKHAKLCPIGIPGELYIGGKGVALGYLNNEEITDKSFIKNLRNDIDEVVYKTGDLVKWLPDGNIEYLGRIDDQVKIRGNRIELGEIQNVLQKYPDVKQSAVLTEETVGGETQLISYLVLEKELNKDAIIGFLRDRLPEYMIPRVFIKIEEIPLTSNGKIDKRALPKRDILNIVEENVYIAPRNENETIITKIWEESLGINKVSVRDDFFEIGGHSMIAIKVMIEIEKRTGKRLPLSTLFERPTIEKIALLISGELKENEWKALVTIKSRGNKTPVYLVHGGGMNVLVFKSMSQFLDAEQPVYAFQALGLSGDTQLFYTIEEIAKKYLEELLTQNPDGPYQLAGYSLGGKIAFEMVKQLLSMGREVKMLGIFDTYIPMPEEGVQKVVSKLVRQFKKIPFMAGRILTAPAETLKYQATIAKAKISNKNESEISADEIFTYNPEMIRAYDIAYNNYKMEPINIPIELFRVKKRIYFLDDPIYLGWKRYSFKSVNIHDIPGDHKTFLFPPNDVELAQKLQKVIDSYN